MHLKIPNDQLMTGSAFRPPRGGGRWDTVRIPDVVLLSSSQWREMAAR